MHPGENRVVRPRGGGVEAQLLAFAQRSGESRVSCACQHSDGGPGTLIRATRNLVVLVALALVVVPAPAAWPAPIRCCATASETASSTAPTRTRSCARRGTTSRRTPTSTQTAARSSPPRSRAAPTEAPARAAPAWEPPIRRARPPHAPQDAGDLAAIASGKEDAPKVDVGGTSLAPDSSGFFNLAGAANEVPLPLMIACAAARPVRDCQRRRRTP